MNPAVRSNRDRMLRSQLDQFGISHVLETDITDFEINRPKEYWTKSSQGWLKHENKLLSLANLDILKNSIARFNKAILDMEHPTDSLRLPDGERCQVVLPPICHDGRIIFSIRKPSTERFTLDNYVKTGRLNPKLASTNDEIQDWEKDMLQLYETGCFEEFFKKGVEHKLNIVTVGGTGSGKTTFSKTLVDLYPRNSRMFIVEDTHELDTPLHENSVHLLFSKQFPAKQVLAACMRLNPDHIFLTEIRGDETWDYLMALKSGHSGSVTSVHANDCLGAMYKIGSYIKQAPIGMGLDMSFIMREVETTIDIVIHFENTYLKEVYYNPEKKLRLLKGENE